eukprot:jgi/Mesen1/4026/ME000212S03047
MAQCCAQMATGLLMPLFGGSIITSQRITPTLFAGVRLPSVQLKAVSKGARRAFVVKAADNVPSEGTSVDTSKFGLGGEGTWFGFGPKQEREVGRLAMIGFVAGIVMEVLTGKGVLAQLGINSGVVKLPFLAGFAFLFIGGLLGGYTVVNNPPDVEKAPPNAGAGLPRDPLKTYDAKTADPLTTFTRGGVVNRPDGQKGREPYVSDIEAPEK